MSTRNIKPLKRGASIGPPAGTCTEEMSHAFSLNHTRTGFTHLTSVPSWNYTSPNSKFEIATNALIRSERQRNYSGRTKSRASLGGLSHLHSNTKLGMFLIVSAYVLM